MAASPSITLRLFRYDPEADAVPRYEDHTVPRTPHMRVLDVLNHVYDKADVPVAHRWYCGTKKCGECALTVNGTPMLSCWEAAEDRMTCEPLANFPILRDLAVDTAPAEARIVAMQPFLTRTVRPAFPEALDPRAMEASNHLAKCIECHLCSAAVPARVAAEGPALPGGAGPAGLVRFARFALDPREEADRKTLATQAGLDAVPAEPALSRLCPQNIDIVREAIEPVRTRLFGKSVGAAESAPASTVFVKARAWSAFVRLADADKQALASSGALQPLDVPGIREAFRAP